MKALRISTLLIMSIFAVGAMAGDAITSVSPNSGPIGGGQTVRLRGTFNAASTVTVGGAAATIITQSTSVIDIVTPVGTAGATTIDTNNGGTIAYSYVNRNTNLRVVVSASIARRVIVRWGGSTSNDDTGTGRAGTYLPFSWTVRDDSAPTGQVDLATTYRSDDASNGKTITIENGSTGVNVRISASAAFTSGPAGTAISLGTPGNDTAQISASFNNQTPVALNGTPQNLSGATNLTPGAANEQPLVVSFSSPTNLVTATYDSVNAFTVALTAIAQ